MDVAAFAWITEHIDLVLTGLALDVVGAILLAKGLFLSPREISDRYYADSYFALKDKPDRFRLMVDVARDSANGVVGVVALATGFALQGASRWTAAKKLDPSGSEIVVFVSLLVLISLVIFAVASLFVEYIWVRRIKLPAIAKSASGRDTGSPNKSRALIFLIQVLEAMEKLPADYRTGRSQADRNDEANVRKYFGRWWWRT